MPRPEWDHHSPLSLWDKHIPEFHFVELKQWSGTQNLLSHSIVQKLYISNNL